MSKHETKQLLLETGTRAFLEHGFFHTGINEVLETAEVPKGSFYYYFKSKEDFGLQVLDRFEEENQARVQHFLTDETRTPLERLRAYFDFNIAFLAHLDYRQGCLIGNMGQEMSDQSEVFRARLDEIMTNWAAALADCFRQAQACGQLSADKDVKELANFCLNSWQGSILRMKVTKDSSPLYAFRHLFFDVILK